MIDPRIAGVIGVETDLSAEYVLTRVGWRDPAEAGGLHHIFVNVLDEAGSRMVGAQVRVSWAGGSAFVPIEEKPGEPFGGNFAMYGTLGSYSVEVSGGNSDKVHGLGTGTPQEPTVPHHTCFELTFQRGAPEPPEPPTPPTPPTDIERVLALLTEAEALIAEAKELLS